MSRTMIIVGAGLCGGRAALGLRDRGFDGRILLIGSEPHAPYDRPPLSKSTLLDEPEPKLIAGPDAYANLGIEHLAGLDVTCIDRDAHTIMLGDGQEIAYDRLLLATGARPRTLPGVAALPHLLTLRTHTDAMAIRARLKPGARLVVIGGGFIGLELAATARQCGVEVTVIEGLPRLMARAVPAEIAAIVEARHRAEGVEILLGASVASLSESTGGIDVALGDGRTIAANFVVVGIGSIPNTALAEQAGLAIDNGIAVDACLTTSDPDIFAAGDCCSFCAGIYGDERIRLESWRSAQDQGTHASGSLLGIRQPFVDVPWFWSDQYDLTLQMAGLANGATRTVRRDIDQDTFILFHLDDAGRLLAASGIGRGNAIGRDIRLAELLIGGRASPSLAALASANTRLKSLLAA